MGFLNLIDWHLWPSYWCKVARICDSLSISNFWWAWYDFCQFFLHFCRLFWNNIMWASIAVRNYQAYSQLLCTMRNYDFFCTGSWCFSLRCTWGLSNLSIREGFWVLFIFLILLPLNSLKLISFSMQRVLYFREHHRGSEILINLRNIVSAGG